MDEMTEMRLMLVKIDTRLEESHKVRDQQHAENQGRLKAIEVECRMTNGRVTRTEERIATLFQRLKDQGDVLTMGLAEKFGKFGGWLVAAVLGGLALMGKL